MEHAITELRLQLRAAGFDPVPCEGKIPPMLGWQQKIGATPDEIELWEKSWHLAGNTGLICKRVPCIDIDIMNPDAADAIEALAREHFEERGSILVRYGKPPKRAIPLRTDAPFKKIAVSLLAPNGETEKIEILSDGQQFIAFGVHPETGKEYGWFGGSPGSITREELPYVREDDLRRFLEEAATLLVGEHGYRRADERPKTNGQAGQTGQGGGAQDWAWLAESILTGREIHDATRDLAGKLVTAGMHPGAAVNFLKGLLQRSSVPHDQRWQERFDDVQRLVDSAGVGRQQQAPIVAAPFVWRDPAAFVPRGWVYGRHYISKFLTTTIAPGGSGKTSLAIVEALAMASGKPLLGIVPARRARVWLWNGEDPSDEVDRRIIAAMIEHNIAPADIDGWLFRNTGRETPIVLATQTRSGTIIHKPVAAELVATIREKQIDVFIVDPFVKCHRINENDNAAIDAIATEWASVADMTGISAELLHHPRKTGGAEVTVEDGRGASSLLSAARSARVLNKMTKVEAANAGLEEKDAWQFFRVDNGKASMAPPPERAAWHKLVSVTLPNGDDVGVATAWSWPNPFDGICPADLRRVQTEIAKSGPWRADVRAERWVGKAVAQVLDLDAVKHRTRIKLLLETWIKNGMLVVTTAIDDQRHERDYIGVGTWADG